eukprot:CAMPEP_0172915964 /NCGR_PEP_ID=MMETSP1075-20121228/195297_1 /TAXON_ID=2916 /ORGANISM="Ceratium fusus, Strain PA161109" /LENGTH=389 /DNA_ID=CAMNT_0013775135 /DNA_START=73 /DNA_END=1242 /DNA_ORIENTATION=-
MGVHAGGARLTACTCLQRSRLRVDVRHLCMLLFVTLFSESPVWVHRGMPLRGIIQHGGHGTRTRSCVHAGAAAPVLSPVAADCTLVDSPAEAASLLASREVQSCFVSRGPSALQLEQAWDKHLQDVPTFDVRAVDVGDAADSASPSAPQLWRDALVAKLPDAVVAAAGRDLLQATLNEAEAMLADFRVAAAAAGTAPRAVQIRLACIEHPQCSRLHWDDVPLRSIASLVGPGTEVMPESLVDRDGFSRLEQLPLEVQVSFSAEDWNRAVTVGGMNTEQAAVQAPRGCVTLLKGSEWSPDDTLGAIHKSPAELAKRVLLQLDYADAVAPPPALEADIGSTDVDAAVAWGSEHVDSKLISREQRAPRTIVVAALAAVAVTVLAAGCAVLSH